MKCPFDRLVVIQQQSEKKTPGGIILPDNKKNQPFRGKVYIAGVSCKLVKEGDEIMFDRTKAFTDVIDGQEYVFMREEEAVLVIL